MKTYGEYLDESERLSQADEPRLALRAQLNALFAYEEDIDPPRDYRFYLTLGDRYSAAGYFEYVDGVYEKALELAGDDELARATVLAERALSHVATERHLATVIDSLDTAESHLNSIEESDEVTGLKNKITDIRMAHAGAIAGLSETEVWAHSIAS